MDSHFSCQAPSPHTQQPSVHRHCNIPSPKSRREPHRSPFSCAYFQSPRSMADMSELAKSLQEQVDIITAHLAKEELNLPSFMPSEVKASITSNPITALPPDVEAARKTACRLSWCINRLLTPPSEQIWWTACKVRCRK